MGERSVKAVVQDAASGDWSIPEFQREFEWKYDQVATLADSLAKGLPIGIFTVWNTSKYNEPQVKPVSGRIPLWIVDGQQRITALCILTGRKPNWMKNDEWEEIFKTKRIYLNIEENGDAAIGRLKKKSKVKIGLDEILYRKPGEVQRSVQEACAEMGVSAEKGADLAVNALSIMERTVPFAELSEDRRIEEVALLYRRLNQLGTKLRQAQIMLAYVSQYNPGWVREEFYPFLERLKDKDDWELDPAQVLQVASILGEGKARVGDATDDMWKSRIKQVWPGLKETVDAVLLHLWERGLSDVDMIPSSYSLITLFSVCAKFKETPQAIDPIVRWFILANLAGRYGDQPLETLAKDGNAIYDATTLSQALGDMENKNFTKDDLAELVRDKFRDNSSQALLLHMMLWNSQAKDWLEKFSMAALTKANGNLEPHWHHIVPKDWGKKHGFEGCDRTANVTRLCGVTNVKKLKTMPPWEYVPKFSISGESLAEHLVPKKYADKFLKSQPLSPAEFKDFLEKRSDLMVEKYGSLLGL